MRAVFDAVCLVAGEAAVVGLAALIDRGKAIGCAVRAIPDVGPIVANGRHALAIEGAAEQRAALAFLRARRKRAGTELLRVEGSRGVAQRFDAVRDAVASRSARDAEVPFSERRHALRVEDALADLRRAIRLQALVAHLGH